MGTLDDLDGDGYTGSEGTEGQDGVNPAWNDYLKDVPQDLHEKVIPAFKSWDQGVQQRFEKVQSEWEPWKGVRESGVNPETALFGINLVSALQNDPEMIYKALKEQYKFDQQSTNTNGNNNGQGQNKPEEEDPFGPYKQELEQVKNQNRQIAEILQSQQQATLNQQAEANLDSELTSLREKHGNYNEQFVLAQMVNGVSAEDAVKAYFTWREKEVGAVRPKPLLLGSGGGVPGNSVDPRKLSDKQTRNLVVDMINASNQENR